jgi:hypothetical protein
MFAIEWEMSPGPFEQAHRRVMALFLILWVDLTWQRQKPTLTIC